MPTEMRERAERDEVEMEERGVVGQPHRFHVASEPQDRRDRPSGSKATPSAASRWPTSGWGAESAATRHLREIPRETPVDVRRAGNGYYSVHLGDLIFFFAIK